MTENITPERRAELRRIADASQNLGAWKAYDGIDWEYRVMAGEKYLADTGDAGATAHISTFDPPTVLALLDQLDAVLALHQPVPLVWGEGGSSLSCRVCGTWPCETVRAIGGAE